MLPVSSVICISRLNVKCAAYTYAVCRTSSRLYLQPVKTTFLSPFIAALETIRCYRNGCNKIIGLITKHLASQRCLGGATAFQERQTQPCWGQSSFFPSASSLFLSSPPFYYPLLPLSVKKWPPSPARWSGKPCDLSQCSPGQSSGHKSILAYFEVRKNVFCSSCFGFFVSTKMPSWRH